MTKRLSAEQKAENKQKRVISPKVLSDVERGFETGEDVEIKTLNPGEQFIFNGVAHYIVCPDEGKILSMSYVLVSNWWSGKEYIHYDPDTIVTKAYKK